MHQRSIVPTRALTRNGCAGLPGCRPMYNPDPQSPHTTETVSIVEPKTLVRSATTSPCGRHAVHRRRVRVISRVVALAIVALLLASCVPSSHRDPVARGDGGPGGAAVSSGEWPHYGNDAGGSRYSPLAEID